MEANEFCGACKVSNQMATMRTCECVGVVVRGVFHEL